MTSFPILDLVAGMIFIFFLLSVISSSVVEAFMTMSGARSKMLKQWLEGIFDKTIPGTDKTLGQSIMDHCSITGLSGKGKSPSYIDAKNFVSVFIEKVTYNPNDPLSVASDFKSMMDRIKESPIITDELKRVLLGYATEVNDAYASMSEKTTGEIELFRNKVAHWFDSSMDRVSGTLKKKWLQPFTFCIGVVITLFMNADSIAIARYLYTNKDAQQSLAALAYSAPTNAEYKKQVEKWEAIRKDTPTDTVTIDQIQADLSNIKKTFDDAKAQMPLGLPLGWENAHFGKDNALSKVAGWILTIFAIFMGAPFWFDMLNKISNLRGSGPKPETSTGKKN